MTHIDPQILQQLNAIAAANGDQRQTLMSAFAEQNPDYLHWLEPFKSTEKRPSQENRMPEIQGYRLIRLIGSGANGRVYLAHTNEQQSVAIKVPNVWLTAEQLQRFRHEAELLKRLQHEAIAKIIEVGTHQVQQQAMPHIVMEFVDGTDIKTHCQNNQMNQQGRVRLMLKVLDAIQHAHQNRVIHRDLKPDNIVVDANGNPKVIDFGIATLSPDATQAMTQLTQTGEVVGTLSYMSPEQVSAAADLDSRSDVYSCGVVLYELLVGGLPHTINPAEFFSAINAIVNEPIKPINDHAVTVDDSLAAVVHHALAKDPRQRFQSAHEFALDLVRWLQGEPVISQALSQWYWIKQAARRHKALVAGTALAFTGLILGLVFAIAFATREQAARALAETRAESNRQAVEFINDLFVNADPGQALGESITVKQVVSSADYAVEKNLADDPEVEAQIRLILGNVNHAMERFDEALQHYDKALSLVSPSETLYPELITEKISLLGATSKFEQQLALIEHAKQVLKPTVHQNLLDRILIDEAANYSVNNKPHEAISMLQQLAQRGQLNPSNAVSLNKQLGRMYREEGDFQASHEVFKNLLQDGIELYGPRHPVTIDLRQELALSLRYLNRLDEAIEIYTQVVSEARAAFTDDSLTTLLARVNLAVAYMYQGNFARAEEETAEVLPKMIEQLGPLHQYTMSTRNIRAGALDNLGRVDEAIAIYQATLDAFAESENKANPVALTVEHNMAVAHSKQQNYEQAAHIYDSLIPRCIEQLGRDNPQCYIFADAMGEVEINRGHLSAAQEWLDYSRPGLIKVFGEAHPRVKASINRQNKLNEKKAGQSSIP